MKDNLKNHFGVVSFVNPNGKYGPYADIREGNVTYRTAINSCSDMRKLFVVGNEVLFDISEHGTAINLQLITQSPLMPSDVKSGDYNPTEIVDIVRFGVVIDSYGVQHFKGCKYAYAVIEDFDTGAQFKVGCTLIRNFPEYESLLHAGNTLTFRVALTSNGNLSAVCLEPASSERRVAV